MKAISLALLMALPMCVTARDEVPILIAVDASCGKWSATSRKSAEFAYYTAWADGLIAGYNLYAQSSEIPLDKLPRREMVALYIDKHCRDQPLSNVIHAISSMVRELAQHRK